MKGLHVAAFILLLVGGLNWLLVGLFDWGVANLVGESVARVVYILVGLSAVLEIFTHKENCQACSTSAPAMPPAGSMGQ